MKISLALLMVMGILLYSALYLGLVYTLFRGQKIIGRAKAFVATFALWSFVWVPLWTVILFFSERQKVVIRPGVDEMLIPDAVHLPPPLVRTIIRAVGIDRAIAVTDATAAGAGLTIFTNAVKAVS